MNTLLLAILVISNVCLTGIGVYLYVKANRAHRVITGTLSSIFYPQAEGRSSAFGEAVQEITGNLAQNIGVQVQAAIKGSIGGTMKGVNAALEAEAVQNDPNAAMMAALPKSMRKNPIALMGLQHLLGKMAAGGAIPGAAGSNGASQAKFNL